MEAEDLERYCRWRCQWQANLETQAIALHCRHGLAKALELTASSLSPAPPPETRAELDLLPVMQEAAVMINDFLAYEPPVTINQTI